jgi:hypothetical protein
LSLILFYFSGYVYRFWNKQEKKKKELILIYIFLSDKERSVDLMKEKERICGTEEEEEGREIIIIV